MKNKEEHRIKRHLRIRKRITGTLERPRLVVHRSLKNLYIQAVDDTSARTIISSSTGDKKFLEKAGKGTKSELASKLGVAFAVRLKEKGISKIAFDRGGYKYHGRIKALADSLRQGGIEF